MRNLILVVVACVVVALIGLVAVRSVFPPEVLEDSNAVVGNYYQTLATIFAVAEEAKDLQDLLRLARGLSARVASPLSELVRAYVQTVVDEEWAEMAQGRASPRAVQRIEDLGRDLLTFDPATGREATVYGEILARMPGSLWALLLVGSVVTIGSMYLFSVKSLLMHALLTGAWPVQSDSSST